MSLYYTVSKLTCRIVCTYQERRISDPLTSYTTLTIHLTDIDDLGPIFSHNATYTLSIPEGVSTDQKRQR